MVVGLVTLAYSATRAGALASFLLGSVFTWLGLTRLIQGSGIVRYAGGCLASCVLMALVIGPTAWFFGPKRLDAPAPTPRPEPRITPRPDPAQIAAAKAAAEKARRAKWKPDPIEMKVYCEQQAKAGILDGEAEFNRATLTKAGEGYTMAGQVIGHNAFNARIAKAAICVGALNANGEPVYLASIVK